MGAVLSAVVPGAGQLYGGRRMRAVAFFSPVVPLVAFVAVTGAKLTAVDLVALLVQPRAIWAFLAGSVAVAAWRIYAVVDAYVLLAGRRQRNGLAWAAVGLLVALVALPHVLVGRVGLRALDLLNSVFVVDEPGDSPRSTVALPSPQAETVPDPATTEQPTHDQVTIERPRGNALTVEYHTVGVIFQDGVGDPDAIAVGRQLHAGSLPSAPFVSFSERVDEERLTILLAGGDRGPGRQGLRTDTMIVATVDINTGAAALFGVPRNLKLVPLPADFRHAFDELAEEVWEWGPDEDEDGFPDEWADLDGDEIPDQPELHCHCFPEILNELHNLTQAWTSTYPNSPDPGMDALADTIGEMIGLPIDYWMLVDMAGFVRLIDAMGGVDVMVTAPLHVKVSPSEAGLPKARVNVEPGMNHLSGSEALAYARWRIGQSDYVRMQRQRCLIRQVAAQADPLTMLRSFTAIADAIEASVVTDIPLSFLPDLVEVVGKIDLGRVATVGLVPPRYNSGRTPRRYPIPNVDRMRAKVAEVLASGVSAQSTTGESECGF